MAAELAEQPEVLGRLVARHTADREQVRAVLPSAHAGTVLLARGSPDSVAVCGRYLIEMASGRPAGLAAPSVHQIPGRRRLHRLPQGVPFAVCGSGPNAELPLPAGLSEITAPILATVRGQQFALASSLRRGLNPDAPAGLSKVTATH